MDTDLDQGALTRSSANSDLSLACGMKCNTVNFEASFMIESSSNNDIFVNAARESKALKPYAVSVNLSLSFSHKIKERRLETSIGFQKGIQPVGWEENRADFFNLRTVFWFTVK